MNYDDAKKLVKDGDVLTFAGDWWMSKVIRLWTRQPVSHVGFAVWLRFGEDTEDRLCVLESMEPGGIRIIPLALAMETSSKVYWQSLNRFKANGNEALGWALQMWGRKYASWFQFLSIVSPRFRMIRRWCGLPVKIGEGYHCSGLVAQALTFGGFEPPKDPALITPGDFWSFDCLTKPVEIEK